MMSGIGRADVSLTTSANRHPIVTCRIEAAKDREAILFQPITDHNCASSSKSFPLNLTNTTLTKQTCSEIVWSNPPNVEIASSNSFTATPPLIFPTSSVVAKTLVHHYPFGINPSLLDSNPQLAKMIAPRHPAFCLPTSPHLRIVRNKTSPNLTSSHSSTNSFSILTPTVLSPITHISPSSTSSSISHVCQNLRSIVEELRKDPLRKVNPPNKVLLPVFHDLSAHNQLAFLRHEEESKRSSN